MKNRSLFYSILIHSVGFGFLSWLLHKSIPIRPLPNQTIQIVELGQRSNSSNRAQTSKKSRTAPHEDQPWRGLQLGLPTSVQKGKRPQTVDRMGNPTDGDEIANSMDLHQETQIYPFIDALWKKIDRATSYPQDFVNQDIHGKTTVQLVVDRRGKFTGEIRSIRGEDPSINTLVVATLVHALREPLNKNEASGRDSDGINTKTGNVTLICHFDFNLIGVGQLPRSVEMPHFKNTLSFRRDARTNPIINRKIEKFLTEYIPPVILIPGGFYIDFPRAYQYIKNGMHPPANEDDLRETRLQLRKQELENLIHQKKEDEP